MSFKSLVVGFVIFAVAVLLGVFELTPLAVVERISVTFLSAFGLLAFVLSFNRIERTFRKWLLVFLFLGLTSTLTNILVHDVGLVGALIGSLRQFSVLACLPLYFWLKKVSVPGLVQRTLIWIGIILFVLVAFGHVQDISLVYEGLVTTVPLEIGVKKLNLTFINLIVCLFLARYVCTYRWRELIAAGLFFSANFFGDLQRAILLAMLLVVLYALLLRRSFSLTFRSGAWLLLGLVVVLGNTSSRELISDKFGEASKILSRNEKIDDFSISARVFEAEIGLEGFYDYPITGFGVIRSSLYEDIYGEGVYFFPSDIGVLGILHTFGLLGLLVFFGQAIFIRRMEWATPFELGIKLFLAFYWLVSLSTGGVILKPLIFTSGVMFYVMTKNREIAGPGEL